jgi:glutamyl-tRNA synthetase
VIRLGELEAPDADVLRKAVPLLKERVKTLGEAREMLATELACLFTMPAIDVKNLTAKEPENVKGVSKKHLEEALGRIDAVAPEPTPDEARAVLAPYADANPKEEGGRGAVLWPLRYALSGQEKSPDPYTLISVLGREEALRRVRAAIAILG